MKDTVPPSPKAALPVLTFNDAIALHINDETVRATHVAPAHTDGDAIVVFERANVLHAGDLFFNGFYPFVDLSSGGSVNGVIKAVDQLLAIANDSTRIIPGHGPLATRADLLAYRKTLATIRDRVQVAVRNGRTLQQVLASKPSADFDEKWGKGFMKPDTFIGIVYESLRSENRGKNPRSRTDYRSWCGHCDLSRSE